SSRRRHTRWPRDWSSDVCSSDLDAVTGGAGAHGHERAEQFTKEPGEHSMRGGQIMHAGKTLWMVVTLAAVGAAALALPYATRGQNSPVATGRSEERRVGKARAAGNIAAGLKNSTTLVNTGTDPVQAVVSGFDSNGKVVEMEP